MIQKLQELQESQDFQDLQDFVQMTRDDRFEMCFSQILKEGTRSLDSHYIFHPAWAARILAGLWPSLHIDIASSCQFIATISGFLPMIEFYDYNPVTLPLSGLRTGFADLRDLPFSDNSVSSLSCMHVVEHVGLGRYGAPIDPEGDLKAITELKRVLAGDLLFVVPISGKPRVIFNLHRIYSYDQITSYFEDLKLVDFTLIPDKGLPIEQATKEIADEQDYGCGCFWFRKETTALSGR